MHWVIQNDLYEEEGYAKLTTAIERLGLTYSVHKVIPFIGEITDPEQLEAMPADTEFIVMGSYSLARQAVRRGWKPGAFLDNLDFEIQHKHWGDRMFNADAKICKFGEVPFQEVPFFLRPVGDSKAFTGQVYDWGEYTSFRDGLVRMGPETPDPVNDPLGVNVLTLDTPVMVCRKKEIYSETRCWLVAGGAGIMSGENGDYYAHHYVATCSGYKVGTSKRYSPPEMVDERITRFAGECSAWWSPNEAYVLDVFDTPNGLKIGEINNLNSAGFYKGDMNKLVMALEKMPRSRR